MTQWSKNNQNAPDADSLRDMHVKTALLSVLNVENVIKKDILQKNEAQPTAFITSQKYKA